MKNATVVGMAMSAWEVAYDLHGRNVRTSRRLSAVPVKSTKTKTKTKQVDSWCFQPEKYESKGPSSSPSGWVEHIRNHHRTGHGMGQKGSIFRSFSNYHGPVVTVCPTTEFSGGTSAPPSSSVALWDGRHVRSPCHDGRGLAS